MSELSNAIAARKSSFPDQFIEKEIPKEILDTLLKGANFAPSHRKTYPWRFVVFKGESKADLGNFLAKTYKKITPQEKFSSFKHKKITQKIEKSGAVIAICMQRDSKESVPEWEEIAATAMAVQNIWLQLEGRGLGGYWSTPGTKDSFNEFYTLPQGQRCLGFFYLGFVNAGVAEDKNRRALSEFVQYYEGNS